MARHESKRGVLAAAILIVPFLLCACSEVTQDDYSGLATPRVAASPRATYFTVVARPGDTLASIGDRYDVPASAIERMNGVDPSRDLAAGEALRIPAGSRRTRDAVFHDAMTGPNRVTKPIAVSYASLPPLASHAAKIVQSDLPPPISAKATPMPAKAVQADVEPMTQPTSVADGDAQFVWPLSGRILSPFGSVGKGERNDGINIAAKPGEPIHAAAGGTVTYAGNELKGYGNLILIRHDDGYVTAYAHAQSISVARGDKVEQGQVIGLAGATGDVDSPQLHFEIRRGISPVDPRPLLVDRSS